MKKRQRAACKLTSFLLDPPGDPFSSSTPFPGITRFHLHPLHGYHQINGENSPCKDVEHLEGKCWQVAQKPSLPKAGQAHSSSYTRLESRLPSEPLISFARTNKMPSSPAARIGIDVAR